MTIRRPGDQARATTSLTASAPTTNDSTPAKSPGSSTSNNDGTTLAALTPNNPPNKRG
ncbi:hypothetical protein [Streptomyces sp. NPDC050528]|uniref:hypothetical protein n=1 Tax=Streptomyces sp. NPDC050528 TaxID=3365623 RepID=UPI0037AB9DDD